tara:strand:- start:14198 stop:14476 length:279 start_codon:yes stop_codon:yes gene_type:complete
METLAKKFSNILTEISVSVDDNLLIYRTNISSKKRIKLLQPFFDEHPHILDWNVDRQDVDNVLRIEVLDGIKEEEVLVFIHNQGLLCEELRN